jgi:hypothetical protein
MASTSNLSGDDTTLVRVLKKDVLLGRKVKRTVDDVPVFGRIDQVSSRCKPSACMASDP